MEKLAGVYWKKHIPLSTCSWNRIMVICAENLLCNFFKRTGKEDCTGPGLEPKSSGLTDKRSDHLS